MVEPSLQNLPSKLFLALRKGNRSQANINISMKHADQGPETVTVSWRSHAGKHSATGMTMTGLQGSERNALKIYCFMKTRQQDPVEMPWIWCPVG